MAQEKYDELENIVSTLDVLIDEITDEYFKGSLRNLKYEAEEQMEEIEEDLRKEQYSEEYEMNYQYERSVC
jgi:hypothetical protein